MKIFKSIGLAVLVLGILSSVYGFSMYLFKIPIVFGATYWGPVIFFIGLELLAILQVVKSIQKHTPKNNNVGFIVGNLILCFWAFVGIFGYVLFSVATIEFKNSEQYEFVTNHIRNSTEYQEKYGEIYDFGLLTSGTTATDYADLHLGLRTDKTNANVDAKLIRKNFKWEIEELRIH